MTPPFADSFLSILPPLLAIGLAIVTRRVLLSLFAGIWLGWTFLAGFDPLGGLLAAVEACVRVFADTDNTLVIVFSALVGALIAFTRYGGGVQGFVDWVTKQGRIQSPRHARLLSYVLGIVIFVESSITSLINGAVSRPIFDRMKISREKLAYLCDSTAAPVCILLPLNAWGAYVVTQLDKAGVDGAVGMLVSSMPFNFYAVGTLLFAAYIAWSGKDFGPMARAERLASKGTDSSTDSTDSAPALGDGLMRIETSPQAVPRARTLILPVVVMVLAMPLCLAITGDGDLLAGSGSVSVFFSVLAGLSLAIVMTVQETSMRPSKIVQLLGKGTYALLPLAFLMVLAFAIGKTTKELGTGLYVAQLTHAYVDPALIPALIFGVAAFIAFSTGTSWGTFGIMLPLAVPLMAQVPGLEGACVAAVLGGGVFGDHCSPISDTTMIASLASGSDHISHVNTQLPYALLVALLTLCLYALTGFVFL
jgi:tetracycline resistance efflux pump